MNPQGRPIAYHITFGTYGARLHGDERGTVDRDHNIFAEPFLQSDPERQQDANTRMRFAPVILTLEQQRFIEDHIPNVCERGGWLYRVSAAAPDHIHVCLSAPEIPGDRIELWLKRWLSESLSAKWSLPDGARWWAKHGSVKWIFDEQHLTNVINYIAKQRTARE